MTGKKCAALLLAFIIFIFSFNGCAFFSGNNGETTSSPSAETQPPYYTEPFSSEPGPQSTTLPEETTAADNFAFDPQTAIELGNINSEIYGALKVYYQDNHIAVFDPFGSLLFSFDAQGLSPAVTTGTSPSVPAQEEEYVSLASDDMNFDGYSDLRILYRTTSLNAYYLCWMWDMTTKTYRYYEPLTTIPTPSFEQNAHTVVSLNKTSKLSATLTTYNWQDGELYPIDHRIVEIGEEETAPAPDDVDRSVSITDGIVLSYVVLNCTGNSNSRWICKVENEGIVNLIGDTYNENLLTHKFVFKGVSRGTTTVVFRYALSWASDYVAEKVLNITVNEDRTLTITEVK